MTEVEGIKTKDGVVIGWRKQDSEGKYWYTPNYPALIEYMKLTGKFLEDVIASATS